MMGPVWGEGWVGMCPEGRIACTGNGGKWVREGQYDWFVSTMVVRHGAIPSHTAGIVGSQSLEALL
jgi:hypothetical protein